MALLVHPDVRVVDQQDNAYRGFVDGKTVRLLVLCSEAPEKDGKRWLHASVSRTDQKMPTYDDLMTLKRVCIGEHRTALQVFPPADKHVDFAKKMYGTEVLHLWSCLAGDVTPDFRRVGPGGQLGV